MPWRRHDTIILTVYAVLLSKNDVKFIFNVLNNWGWVTNLCIGKLIITGSDNGMSPGRCQAIIWTNAGILLIGPLGTNFSQILIEVYAFSFKKMNLKMSGKWRPFCLSLNVFNNVVSKWLLWSSTHFINHWYIIFAIFLNSVFVWQTHTGIWIVLYAYLSYWL